jgi:hypothetical protein
MTVTALRLEPGLEVEGEGGVQIEVLHVDAQLEKNRLCRHAKFTVHTAKTKCQKFETNIPRKGISGPQSQFPHSFVCERIKYSHDGSACSAGGNM